MNVLIIGAGALGQFFGLHLARGGATVSYLVKPAQAARARAGFRLFQVPSSKDADVQRLVPHKVFVSPAEIGAVNWDAVWLCIHSTILRDEWLAELRDRVSVATVVSIGQDLGDRPQLERWWPAAQIVEVVPSVFAYQAPLAQEPVPEPGIAYWIPRGAAFEVSGADKQVEPLVSALNRGGLQSKNAGTVSKGYMTAALTMPYIVALEASGWSLRNLRKRLKLAAGAAREATAAVAATQGTSPPARLATSALMARFAFWLLPRIAPFDLERYSQVHFTKVSEQTRQMLRAWIAAARSRGLPVTFMEELRTTLPQSRSG